MGLIERGGIIAKASLEGNRFNERQRVLRSAKILSPVVYDKVIEKGRFTSENKTETATVIPVLLRVEDFHGHSSKNKRDGSDNVVKKIIGGALELGFEYFSQEACESIREPLKNAMKAGVGRDVYIGMKPETYDESHALSGVKIDFFHKDFRGVMLLQTAVFSHIYEMSEKGYDERWFLFGLGEEPSIKDKKK